MGATAIRAGIEHLRVRLDRIDARFAPGASDDDFLERLAEIELAINAMGSTIGVERRSTRLRMAARRADAEIAFLRTNWS